MVERTDIDIDGDLDASLNDRGDLVTVQQRVETLEQRAVLRSLNVTYDELGTPVTPHDAEDVRDRVERALQDDSVLDVPVYVYIAEQSRDTLVLDAVVGEQLTFSINPL